MLVERFAGTGAWEATERRLQDGTMSVRDVLQWQASYVRGSYAEVAAMLRADVMVDPGFAAFAALCRRHGAALCVVSSGIERIVRDRLDEAGVRDVRIVANDVDAHPQGWKMRYRDDTPNGLDKTALVDAAHARGLQTLFIGDGRSDYQAAVAAERRFAKRGRLLERYLRKRKIAFEPYGSFADITAILTAQTPA